MRLTFNINAPKINTPQRRNKLFDLLVAMNVPAVVVFENLGIAREIQALLSPDAIVVHRSFGDSEGWKTTTPSDMVNKQIHEQYNGIYDYGINEPGPDDRFSWEDIVRFEVERIQYASEHGQRIMVLNVGPALIERQVIANGVFDPVLRKLAEHPEHLLATHEYTSVFRIMGTGVAGMGNCEWERRENFQFPWPGADVVARAPRFHVRSTDHLIARNTELGLPTPRVFLTEWGWDRMPDHELAACGNLFTPLTERFGVSRGHELIRGHDTLANVYEWYFPDLPFEEVLFQQIVWEEAIQPAHVIGWAWFMWGPGDEQWDRRFGFDMSTYDTLHARLIEFAGQQPLVSA
ncbi:MAG: hypothetical protein D6737_17050, partial [Chloroflexi bacterium]